MPIVMRQTDPVKMLRMFVGVFGRFWSSDRVAIRRIHALAVPDPELGQLNRARNERRRMAASRVVNVLCNLFRKPLAEGRSDAVSLLFARASRECLFSMVSAEGIEPSTY